jgi:hypothetical protein
MVEEWVPREEPKRQLTEQEQQRAEETLAYLEALPWRPFGEEW